jgi:hypothetical protein
VRLCTTRSSHWQKTLNEAGVPATMAAGTPVDIITQTAA